MTPSDQSPPGNAVAIRNNLSGFQVAASTMDEAMRVCEYISKSGMVPKAYVGNPAAIWCAGAMGARLGLDLFQSLNGIASINGRPSVWGDLARALILRHPELEGIHEDCEGEGEKLVAVCAVKRRGLAEHVERFSIEDAKKARLTDKDIWKLYARDMLISKAFARAVRRRFADVLQGLDIHGADDLQTIDAEVVGSSPLPEATPARRRTLPRSAAAIDQAPPANQGGPASDPGGQQAPVQTASAQTQTKPADPGPLTVAAVIAKARAWHETVPKAEGTAALKRICHALGVVQLALATEDQAQTMDELLNEEIAAYEHARQANNQPAAQP